MITKEWLENELEKASELESLTLARLVDANKVLQSDEIEACIKNYQLIQECRKRWESQLARCAG